MFEHCIMYFVLFLHIQVFIFYGIQCVCSMWVCPSNICLSILACLMRVFRHIAWGGECCNILIGYQIPGPAGHMRRDAITEL